MPRRFSLPMREIWMLQPRLEERTGRRPLRLLSHPRFRAAYDFLLLRGEAGEVDEELCRWWTEFQQETADLQEQRLAATVPSRRRSRGRRRRSRAGAKRPEDTP
jgi:poly(A) polymerase